MHFGNGQASAQREDGASPPVLGLRLCPFLLLLLGLGSGAASGTGWCQPCPGNCTCVWGAEPASCLVNCSARGLLELHTAPAHATVLDLSNNSIENLDKKVFEHLHFLQKLDISYNQISTLEPGIFANISNLTEINLSGNPWVCDCRLSWLPRWAEDSGVTLLQINATLCHLPPVVSSQPLLNVSFSRSSCGVDLISCPRNPSAGNESVLIFIPNVLGNLSTESCSALCFVGHHTHGALDPQHGCLCGDALSSNTSSSCLGVCESPTLLSSCGLTLIHNVFSAQLSAFVNGSKETFSLAEPVELQTWAPVPVIPRLWDFGDGTVNTTETKVSHRYALPGLYNVTVTLQVGVRDVLVHNEVNVVGLPEKLQIMCPLLVRTNDSLLINVSSRGGTELTVGYNVTSEQGEAVFPMCPPGSQVFPGNNHCYQLVSEKAGWFEAQRICGELGHGDLAIVSSREVRDFLRHSIISGLEVWIGFNDSGSAEDLPEGKHFNLESCQNWLPGQPEPSQADRCVRMGHTGVCNTDLCSAEYSYVCEYKPQDIHLNAEYFVAGPGFDRMWPLKNVTRSESVSSPGGSVEVLVFPDLRFTRDVYLSSLEFVTEELQSSVQMRFQVFKQGRQECKSESTIPPPTIFPINETIFGPEEELDSSNNTNSSLEFGSGSFPANMSEDVTPAFPRSKRSLPSYDLVKEYLFIIPPGNATQYLALIDDISLKVQPDHLFVIQHNSPTRRLLHCPSEQYYITFHRSDWMHCIAGDLLSSPWINVTAENSSRKHEEDNCVSCSIRVIGTTEEIASIFSPNQNSGLSKPGLFTVTAHFKNQAFYSNTSCNIHVVSPVSGLRAIYPPPQQEIIYVPTNNTVLVLKILSGSNATASWAGSNQSWDFQRTCPSAISALTTECAGEEGDVWYSEIHLDGLGKGFSDVAITVRNVINSENLTVRVKLEDPISGLSASPCPQARVLVNVRVNNVASVESGSDVSFKWTVDDKPSFSYYNAVFHVIYQSAAVYKLTLTATNHVSSATVSYNVTVENMKPMSGLVVSGVPDIATQNAVLELSAKILIDSAMEAVFNWTFGDGTHQVYQFWPPYNQSFSFPNPSIHQVLLENNVSHTYQESGFYNITLCVSNTKENRSQTIQLQVQSFLTNLSIETDAEVVVVGRTFSFQAMTEPSSFGVLYTWDFDDGSLQSESIVPLVNHTFLNVGMYNVSLKAKNNISEVWATKIFYVYEEITGLAVCSDKRTERGLPTFVNASVETGDNITWTFNMGDGYILEGNEPMINYTYSKDGNYTVNVTASNPVNSLSETLNVSVYVLQVLNIEPSSCILENPNVTLTANVTGDFSGYTFNWTLGNGSSSVTIYGFPSVQFNFSKSGIYPLSLILSSQVNKAYYYTNVCIEPEIINVTLLIASRYVSLGNESHFEAIVFPLYQYKYKWDFGTNSSKQNGGREISYTYPIPGLYQVTVYVFNNVSSSSDTTFVDIQEAVGPVTIEYNGTDVLELDQIYVFTSLGNGTKVKHLWDFGDGNIQEGQSVVQVYNSTGSFTISLNSWNDVSSSKVSHNVTVKTRIQGLTMTANWTVVPLNSSVSFTASLLAGDDVRYMWILCDRCTPMPGSSTIIYTFRSIGTFNVIVTAENEIGSLQYSVVIYVLQMIEGLQIVAADIVNDCCFPTNRSLLLQATVMDGTNISYSWVILKNDSVIQSGFGKTYQFTSMDPEIYTIILKAANMLGNTTVSRTIEFIESIDQIKLLAFPNPAAVNSTVNISMALSSGSGVTYTWYLEENVIWFTYESFVLYNYQSPSVKEVFAIANNTLGSVNSTIYIFIQEPIEGLTISADHKGDYVPTGTVLYLSGSVQRGTNVSWSWQLPDSTKEGQSVTVNFCEAGHFTVSLNASNDVSWETDRKSVTVQDRIQGLKLLVSKKVVEPGEKVTFTIQLSAGSSVNYKLTINGDYSILLNSTSYTHEFTKIGGYPVTVVAHNQVSEDRVTVMISVLEAIKDLKIVNCCEVAMPTGIEKSFMAEVSNGSLVAYTWQFDLQNHSTTSLAGKNVTYTPKVAGLLKIHLSALNDLGGQNITKIMRVQDQIKEVTLKPVNTFVNRSVTFEAIVLPSSLDVTFRWMFGDGSPAHVTHTPTANHSYLAPGDYMVEVNASNLIGFVIAQMTVTTRTLECEEPVVQLSLPPQVIMRRSQRNYIEAEIDLRGCISYQTEHLWEIFRASSCLHYHESDKVHLQNVDVSRPQLVIPKLALDIGDYCFVFSVTFGDTPLSRNSFANVSMMPSKLVPIIDGGSYRVWSKSRDLLLDGNKSYDPNLEEDGQTPLKYKWSCTVSSKNSEDARCPSDLNLEMGLMVIPKSVLREEVEYTFFLTVSKAGRSSGSTNQTVLIKKGKVPIVSLKCVSCKAQSVYEVSASSYVYLEGSCTNCQDESRFGRWTAQSFSNKSLTLDMFTTTTGDREMNLVLRKGALEDGLGYTFTLHVTDPTMDEEGFASIDLLPNTPPAGGACSIFPNGTIHALATKIQFECTGWRDEEDDSAVLVFSLIVRRCKSGLCEEFWVYKGSRSEHSTYLPVGFHESDYVVDIAVVVQDQQGAATVALNHSMTISLPVVPNDDFAHWLRNLTESALHGLMKQGDPQHVTEFSLALITVLNEYEQNMAKQGATIEQDLHIVRQNITEALISLNVNTVDDIRQISAALAQCTVSSKKLVCSSCQIHTLNKLEAMMSILQNETTQGTMTPTTIADNILNIMGDLIHLVNTNSPSYKTGKLCQTHNSLTVAYKAYNLSSDLMRILMKSRVLNEEPLSLQGGEIMAWGKRSDPLNLLCYINQTGCQFLIPHGFNNTFPDLTDIIQVIFQMYSNPYPFGFISNYTVSTNVASMEFQTSNGSQIPLDSLDSEKAINVSIANNTKSWNITVGVATVDRRSSVKVEIETESRNRNAGLHIQVNYSILDERYIHSEPEPFITVYLHESGHPNQYNCTDMKRIGPNASSGSDHKLYTFFIEPMDGNLTRHYYLNITNHYLWTSVDVTVGLYTSLCQYFDENIMRWKTEGVVPLADTRPDLAVCLTHHLTAFAASLFVPPHSVVFIHPPPPPGLNYIVLLTCAVCFVTYSVATIIVHKLDLLDVNKAGVIPFCGKAGFFKYEVLVKTGWGRSSGTTAHVGISLYGVDNKSGHRHLDGENTFHRNSVDIFQIATERSLGNVWKIRLWHDNKGLSPSWYVQHVIIRDLQSSKNYFFLVNDWLSVGQEDSGRRVEREIFAASETELKSFSRIFVAEMQRGISEKHVWLSMWDRPPRSRFTRVQRATCCALLIFLFLCANAIWYGVVGDQNHGDGAVSTMVPLSVDSVAAGMVTSVLVYPIYLVILFLFRRARSKTCVQQSLSYFDQQSLEMDNYLDAMVMDSSFISYTGIHGEAFSEQTKTDIHADDTKSFIQWNSSEGMLSWPDLLSDPTIMGNTIQKLERRRTLRHLGIDGSSHPSEDDSVVLGLPHSLARQFVASDDASSMSLPRDLRRISRTETDLLSDLSNPFGDKTDTIILEKLNEKGQAISSSVREVTRPAKSPRTVITDAFQRSSKMLPSWCSRVAHALSGFLLICCFAVSSWIGVGFTSSVGLMWLISGIFSFLCSFFVLEPLKVLVEALYFAGVVKRLHPEEEDTLVECPLVEKVSERITKVRPPQGFALFQAREEAQKVKLLHRMLKNLVVYMLFFLVILITNYGDTANNSRSYLLQRSVRQELGTQRFLHINRTGDFYAWGAEMLLPYLHSNQQLHGSYSSVIGIARLRQIRLKKAMCSRYRTCPEVIDDTSHNSSINPSHNWSYSPPDATGAWYWGFLSFYDSSGYIQHLGSSLEENKQLLEKLQRGHWIDSLTRALFVEFSLYTPGVDLYTSVTLLLEFPLAGRTLPSTEIRAFPLLRLSSGTHLLLVMMVFLMMFVVYFVLSECLVIRKEGLSYFTRFWNYVQWLLTALAVCTVVVYLSRASLADQQWDRYLKNRETFISLRQVAFLDNIFHILSASLLFILTVKAAQQMRFIREWSVFGKTLSLSVRELCAVSGVVLGLLLVYAQLGFLLFSSSWESFHSFGSSVLTLFSVARGSTDLKTPFPNPSWVLDFYFLSYLVLKVWILLRFFAVVLIHSYCQVRMEMFRPAFEPQDYEMVELFLRRLRIWMGVSKVKEFRHKVRFEGMEPLPSRSSSDSKSLRGPTPSAASDTSSSSSFSTISSHLDTLSAVSTRERVEIEANIQRLLPVLETLLSQFDLVNQATEEVYQIERCLEDIQTRTAKRKSVKAKQRGEIRNQKTLSQIPQGPPQISIVTARKSKSYTNCHATTHSVQAQRPSTAPQTLVENSAASRAVDKAMGEEPALIPMQITHSAQTKKRKSMRAHNRVHPSVS